MFRTLLFIRPHYGHLLSGGGGGYLYVVASEVSDALRDRGAFQVKVRRTVWDGRDVESGGSSDESGGSMCHTTPTSSVVAATDSGGEVSVGLFLSSTHSSLCSATYRFSSRCIPAYLTHSLRLPFIPATASQPRRGGTGGSFPLGCEPLAVQARNEWDINDARRRRMEQRGTFASSFLRQCKQ